MLIKIKRHFSTLNQQFEKFISDPLKRKDEQQFSRLCEFQRKIQDYNLQISKNYNFYDPDIMTPTKEEKNKYLADSVFKLNAQEKDLFFLQLIDRIKNNSTKENYYLNQKHPIYEILGNFKIKVQKPFNRMDPNFYERQRKLEQLQTLGVEGFKNLMSCLGGSVTEEKPVKEEQEEKKIVVEEIKEKQFWDVQLTSFDQKDKIKIIKEVRGILNLGLKEVYIFQKAKDLVEKTPAVLQKDLKKADAEILQKKLKEAGCVVDLI